MMGNAAGSSSLSPSTRISTRYRFVCTQAMDRKQDITPIAFGSTRTQRRGHGRGRVGQPQYRPPKRAPYTRYADGRSHCDAQVDLL